MIHQFKIFNVYNPVLSRIFKTDKLLDVGVTLERINLSYSWNGKFNWSENVFLCGKDGHMIVFKNFNHAFINYCKSDHLF